MVEAAKEGPELSTEAGELADLVYKDRAFRNHPARISWARDRWLDRISHLDDRISSNKRLVFGLRGLMVFGALLVPILATGAANAPENRFWRWATVVVSIVVALCTATDQIVRPAARWRLVRQTRGALEAEGWSFLEGAGRYAGLEDDERFQVLFNAVERLWDEYEQIYLAQIAHVQELPSTGSSEPAEGTSS